MKGKETQVIRALIEMQGKELNISRLSEYACMDYKNTYTIVRRLEKSGVVVLKPFGRNIRVTLRRKPHPLVYQAEFERTQEFLKKRDFLVLYKKLHSLNFPFIALVFGSHVKGRVTRQSDVDLLVISEPGRAEAVQGIIDLFPFNIHLTLITFDDFASMLRSREFSVVSEAVRKNIVLVGIEDYYRLMENAG